jgi:hypothetical protein
MEKRNKTGVRFWTALPVENPRSICPAKTRFTFFAMNANRGVGYDPGRLRETCHAVA